MSMASDPVRRDSYYATRSILCAIEANDVGSMKREVQLTFLGFSRYSNKVSLSYLSVIALRSRWKVTNPSNTLVNVGGSVRETLDLSRLSSEKTVEVGSDLVGLTGT
jgi:hypothetical protein